MSNRHKKVEDTAANREPATGDTPMSQPGGPEIAEFERELEEVMDGDKGGKAAEDAAD